jgi:hypothetical protein
MVPCLLKAKGLSLGKPIKWFARHDDQVKRSAEQAGRNLQDAALGMEFSHGALLQSGNAGGCCGNLQISLLAMSA